MIKKFIVLFLLIDHANAFEHNQTIKDCSNLTDQCEYYLCLETQKQCGENGYLSSFGHKYCQRFELYTQHNLSDRGKLWLDQVRSCLIEKLENFETDLTCSQLKTEAFRSHVPCYQEAKFCNLSLRDKYQVIRAIGQGLKSAEVLKAGLRVLRSCRVF